MSFVNGLSYEYKNNQSDITIVFLHGWGMSGDCFEKIVHGVQDYSTLTLDLYGFGNSIEPQDYFDTYEYSYRVFLLLKMLDIKNIVLVGHSFGGRLSILLSSIFEIDVRGIVLASSAGLNRFSIVKWLKIKKYKITKWLVKHKVLKEQVLEKFGSRDLKNAKPILKQVLKKVVCQDLSYLLKNINIKTLLIWDKKDKETPYWICKKFNKTIPLAKSKFYNTGRHFSIFYNVNKFSIDLGEFCESLQ